jgi:hypothetical protein
MGGLRIRPVRAALTRSTPLQLRRQELAHRVLVHVPARGQAFGFGRVARDAVQDLLGIEVFDEVRQPLDVGRGIEHVELTGAPGLLELRPAQDHQVVHLDARDARLREDPRRAARAFAAVAGQPEDRVPDHVQTGFVAALDGPPEVVDAVEAPDVFEHLVVGGFEAELDPDLGALREARQLGEGFRRQRVGPRRDAHRDDGLAAQVGFDRAEHFGEPCALDVGVRVRLEVGDHASSRIASRDARDAGGELGFQLRTGLQRARAGPLDVAVDATAEALRTVAVRAGRARVERDAVHRAAEARGQPGPQGAEGEGVGHEAQEDSASRPRRGAFAASLPISRP